MRLSLLLGLALAAGSASAQFSFSAAQPISGQWGGITNDNTGVVPDPGGPSHAGFAPRHPLWYTWIAPESGEVTFDTIGSIDTNAVNIDTVLAVYTAGGTGIGHLIQVAANDDYYPYVHQVESSQTFPFEQANNPFGERYPLPFNGPSILRFNATAGTTYYIAVDAIPGKGVTFPGVQGATFSLLSQTGEGAISLNWAFRPSGVLRFAGEDFDLFSWQFNQFINGTIGMPRPMYQCTEWETFIGLAYSGGETVHDSYYQFDPEGLLVTVTRLGGSRGRLFVDYATQDGDDPFGNPFRNATATNNYVPASGTLVFDDQEMSKTIRVKILSSSFGYNTSNSLVSPDPTKLNVIWNTNFDKDFSIVLSNPRLDPLESPNVSPPRLDGPFATTTIRMMSMAGLGQDPDEDWTGDPDPTTAPTHDVYNFGKRNYYVPRDITNFWTEVIIGVLRTHAREVPRGTRSETIHYRVNGTIGADVPPQEFNNFFPLNPGSDYALPDPINACDWIFPWGATNLAVFTNFDFTFSGANLADGTVTIGNTDVGIIRFLVSNDTLTKFNKDFNITLYRVVDSANVSVGENNECHVTILFDDKHPPAGSVDEFYNTDFGTRMKPPVSTVPSNQPHPGTDGTVWDLAVQPDNKAIIVGEFTSYNGTTRNCIARATATGPIDTTFNPGTGANDGMISSLQLLPDGSGKMMIGGLFTHYNGADRKYIARLTSTGLRDATFAPSQDPNGAIWALAVLPNNQVIIAGDFSSIGTVPRSHIARYNANGSLDLTFDPGANAPNDTIWSLALQPDGKVVIGGQFTALGSQSLSGLARLNTNGTADATFDGNLGSGVDGTVYAIALQGGTNIVIGGEFQNVGIAQRTRIARLNSDGTVDNTFNSGIGADDTVYNISAQSDGSMYVGGLFTSYNGTHRLGLTRLYVDGSVDTTFLDTAYNQFAGLHRKYYDRQWPGPGTDPNPDSRPFILASQVLPNGNVVIGGGFRQVGGGQADASIHFDSDYPYSGTDTNLYMEPKSRDGIRNRNNFARLVGGSTPGPGNIGLLYNSYSVNKSQLSLDVDLVRTNGSLGYSSANFAVQPGLAQSGTDYAYNSTPPLYTSSWDPAGGLQPYYSDYPNAITRAHEDGLLGNNEIPNDVYNHFWFGYTPGLITLTIENSGIPGDVDTQVQLANPSGEDQFFLGGQNIPLGNALGVSVAPLTIVDDNHNAGVIGFASLTFSVNEKGTNAVIVITRTNGAAGNPSVILSTVENGTGHAGSNYVTYSKRLSFAPGVTSITNTEIKVLDDNVREPNGLTVGLRLTGLQGQNASLGLSTATLNIIDNDYDPGYVTFSSASYTNNETSGAAILTVIRSGANKGTMTVQCATTNGTAISGVNYTGVTNTLTWNDGDSSPRFFTVPLINSGLVGSNTTFKAYLFNPLVTGTNAPFVLAGSPISANVTIVDDNFYGKLQFSAPSYTVNENGGYATISVVRVGGSAETLGVHYATTDGNAISAGPVPNFVATSGTLTFGPGEITKSFNVTILDDGQVDPGPPFFFNVGLSGLTPAAATYGFPTNVQVFIQDAELFNRPAGSPDSVFNPNPGFNGDVFSVAIQSGGQIVAAGSFSTVNNYPRNNIARLNADGSMDTTFLNGLVGANAPIQAVLVQTDGRVLAGGSFSKMNGLNRNGLARLMTDGTLDSSFNTAAGGDNTIFALAESFAPDRRLLIGGSFLNVNGFPHSGIARLNNSGTLDSSFSPSLTVNGTVYAIAVYPTNGIQAGKIMIGGSFTTVNGTSRNGIARLNSDGTLDLGFDPGTGANDAVRALAIQLDGRVLMGGSFTAFNGSPLSHIGRLNVDGSRDNAFNVGAGANDTVSAIAVQVDNRIVVVGQFTTASGVSRSRITRLLPDGTVDPAINFGLGADGFIDTLALQSDGMMVIGGGFTHFDGQSRAHLARIYGGSIAGGGQFEFTSANFLGDENATNAVVTIRRIGGTTGSVGVDFATTPGTAVAGVNYSNVVTTVIFPEGETFQTVTIPVMDDSQITPDLTVNLSLSNAPLGDQPVATLTIVNNDSSVSFAAAAISINEDVSGGAANIHVLRQGSTRGTASVDFFTTTNGTAIAFTNYIPTSNTVTFLPGQTDVTVSVPILHDPQAQGDRTVIMELTNAINALLFEPKLETLSILDVEQLPGQLLFSQTNYVVGEGGGSLAVTILRTNGHSGLVSVGYTTLPGSALPGVRYTTTSGNLTFADGETSKTFNVPIIQDSVAEGNQVFSLLLSNASGGATISGPATVPVTVIDDDTGISFSSPAYVVSETAGTVSLTVLRPNGTNGVTTVNYATTNLTALAGTNYTSTSGTLSFTNGETIKSFSVPILHDPRVTGDLSFAVNLSNPSFPAQLISPSLATVVILDSEAGFSFTNSNFGVLKSATNVLITVARSNVNTGTVSVQYATTNGTAASPGDYTASSGLLTFSNGIAFQSFTVPIINNSSVQGDRFFTIGLFNPSPTNIASVIPPGFTTVTITDDTSALSFSSPIYTVNENGGSALISVTRSNNTNSIVSVDYATANGSAQINVNYQSASGTLTFTNGETLKSFSVPVIDNGVSDGDKTVLLSLSNPIGKAQLVNPSAATLTIRDIDGSLVLPAGAALTFESGPVNGLIDTNETVTVLLALRNASGTNTANLVATLLSTNGVVPTTTSGVPNSQSQTYGVLPVRGPSAYRPFTFTASGTNGQTIAATLQLRDGATVLNNAVFTFTLGNLPTTYSNSAAITINDFTNATPYPSIIHVSSLAGIVTKVTATLTNLSHTWPGDIDALLVSPAGQKSYLMAKCGGGNLVSHVTLTFDDAAASTLPQNSTLAPVGTSRTNRPTSYAIVPPPFPAPAPPAPYITNLSGFNGSNPNGDWSLFVFDDSQANVGVISNGWILKINANAPNAADVGLSMAASQTSNIVVTSNLTYTITASNYGPADANGVVVTDTLPAGTAYVSSSPSQGSASTNGAGLLTWSVGVISNNAYATLTLVVQPNVAGSITNSATVTSSSVDANPDDDTASLVSTVVSASADLVLALAGSPNPVLVNGSLTYTISVTNLGPATAAGLSVTNTLPPTVNFVSASPAGYTVAGRVVTFTNLGNLGSGANTSATIVVKPTAAGTITNAATCASTVSDPFKANNSATVKNDVEALQLSFVRSGTNFVFSWPGDLGNYTLESATNLAPPITWTLVTNPPPGFGGGPVIISIPIGKGTRFFRLHSAP